MGEGRRGRGRRGGYAGDCCLRIRRQTQSPGLSTPICKGRLICSKPTSFRMVLCIFFFFFDETFGGTAAPPFPLTQNALLMESSSLL